MYHSCAWFDVRVTLWECEVTGAGLLVGSTEGGSDRIIIPMCTRAFSPNPLLCLLLLAVGTSSCLSCSS